MPFNLVWHVRRTRSARPGPGEHRKGSDAAEDHYGLTWKRVDRRTALRRIGKSWLLAALVALAAYLALVASDYFFKSDFRFWVFAVKLMSPLHLRIAVSYLIPFTVFFVVLGTVLHGQLRRPG